MMSLVLIYPAPDVGWAGQRLDGILKRALAGREVRTIRRAEELSKLENQRLVFALALGDTGVNIEYARMLARLREAGLPAAKVGEIVEKGDAEILVKGCAELI